MSALKKSFREGTKQILTTPDQVPFMVFFKNSPNLFSQKRLIKGSDALNTQATSNFRYTKPLPSKQRHIFFLLHHRPEELLLNYFNFNKFGRDFEESESIDRRILKSGLQNL